MPLRASDFDEFDRIDPFTQMESNPEKLHRCVRKVRAKGGVDNPWAVCNAAMNK